MAMGETSRALAVAAADDNATAMRTLLQAGANVNLRCCGGMTVLQFCARGGHFELLQTVLEHGKPDLELDTRLIKWRAIHYAAYGGGPGVSARPGIAWGVTPPQAVISRAALPGAVRNDYAAITRLLVEAGAQLDFRNRDGRTALMLACAEGNVGSANVLLEGGADPSVSDLDGRTALWWASFHCHEEVVKALTNSRV
jgi:ankyrin repeat protein